jgi:tetratricopeptide (TPR) repeat protein
VAFAIVAIAGCVAAISISARFGFSRLLTTYAKIGASLPAADRAVQLTPDDADAHRARGAILRYEGNVAQAVLEYEKAVSLRPLDDLLWSELGVVREELEDRPGALTAMNESVRTAPFYAVPRWQRGNVLLRMGRYDEGFADLRRAAASDQALQPNLFDLAWGLSRSDLKLTKQILQINNQQMQLSFARFLAKKGLGDEVVEQIRGLSVPDPVRKEIVSRLIAKDAFPPAFEIWSNSGASSGVDGERGATIFDGGFEAPLTFDESGFGWRVVRGETGLALAVDVAEKQSGLRSLRIQFNGNSHSGLPLVSQLILVKPAKRYRVSFASRAQDLVTGGLPLVIVTDARYERILARAAPIREGTHAWKLQSFEFDVGPEEKAVRVSLRREDCATNPCPIFGLVWLDSFSVEELN